MKTLGLLACLSVVLVGCGDEDPKRSVGPSAAVDAVGPSAENAPVAGAVDGVTGVQPVVPSGASAVDGAAVVDGASAAKVAARTPEEARAALSAKGISSTDGAAFRSAAGSGNLEVVQLFVEAGMDIESADDELGWTALMNAAERGHLAVVEYLVGQGANVNAADEDGYTVLMNAVWRADNLPIVRYLVDQGANIWATAYDGMTARRVAVTVSNTSVADYLKSLETTEEFILAAAAGNLLRVRLYVEWGIDKEGQAVVTVGGVRRERTALHAASAAGHLEVVKYLVNAGASLSSTDGAGDTPLHAAIAGSAAGSAKRTVSHDGPTLHQAVEAGKLEIVQYLVGRGANVDVKNSEGETPLHIAAKAGAVEIAEYLVAQGANVELQDNAGNTPLDVAEAARDATTDTAQKARFSDVAAALDAQAKSPDLVVSASVSPATVSAGASFTLSATVSNRGSASASATTLTYYRSADATITTGDTALGSTENVGELDAEETSTHSRSLTAPSSVGTYYYGVCVSVLSDESNSNNNCSSGLAVEVVAPDLVVQTPTVSTATPLADASFTLSATVENRGSKGSVATTLTYYRSADATITTGDTSVGTDNVGVLSASGTSPQSISVTAPSSAGTYYYGACVAAVTGESNTTNNCSASVTVTVPSPDLVVSASMSTATVSAEQSITVSATVSNSGTGSSAATTLTYYRSADATISTSDTALGSTDAVSGLGASGTSAHSRSLTAPSSVGTYYYGACVASVTGEKDTSNNCSSGVKVTVVAPDLVVQTPTVDDSTPTVGDSITVSATVSNRGSASASATTLRYYRSADATISTSDTEVGTDNVGVLSASGTSAQSIRLLVPSTADTYYYGACVDDVSGETAKTNNCSAGVSVTVTVTATRTPEEARAELTRRGIAYEWWEFAGRLIAGDLEVVTLFVQAGMNVNAAMREDDDTSTPLSFAAQSGHLEVVKYLVGQGANVNAEDDAFHSAARFGHLEVVKYLVGQGANVNAASWWGTPLFRAAAGGRLEVVKYLVGQGANVNAATNQGYTPLHQAAAQLELELVQYLVGQGANVNAATNGGETPLLHAVIRRASSNTPLPSLEVVKYLVGQGANVNAATNDANERSTPLHWAAYYGDLECVKYLVGQGANVNAQKSNNGATPLLWFVASYGPGSSLELVQYLVGQGASINAASTFDGTTSLHWAARYGHLELVKYLVGQGANVNAQDNNGLTPRDYAAQGKFTGTSEVVSYLDSL